MSATESTPADHFRFGQWQFDAATGDLSDGAVCSRLEPQVAKLLTYFLTHQNVLSSRDDLIAAVWDGRIVSDDAINRCISILRHTLTPGQKNAYIETVVRRGFISHFPAPDPDPQGNPEPEPAADRTEPVSHVPWHVRKGIAAALAMLGLLFVLGYAWFGDRPALQPASGSPPAQTDAPVVAVLPFAHSDFAGDGAFFANGVHDDLLTQLAQIESIRVISRTSMLEYRDTDRSIAEIGQDLGADAILEGSVQRVGDQFRINVQLIDVQSDTHLWADRYDRELLPAQIFQVQTEIASAIGKALQVTLSAEDSGQLAALPTANMAAYRAYHEAMTARDRVSVNAPEYLSGLERAVSLDPEFTRAWVHLVGHLCYQNFSSHDPQSIARIEEILELIRTQAPDSADLWTAQAYYTYYVLRDYEQAYDLVKRAHLMRPSDERVVELRSYIERRLGNFQARVDSIRLLRKLDPRNPLWTTVLAINLGLTHQYAEALATLRDSRFVDRQQSVLASMLQVQEHGDFERWRAELDALHSEYGAASVTAMWSSRIASRDYAGALELLDGLGSLSGSIDFPSAPLNVEIMPLITQWLLADGDRLQAELELAQTRQDRVLSGEDDPPDYQPNLVLAYVSAATGDVDQTRRQLRLWRREVITDKAEYALTRHYACRALGMAAAMPETVQCLRSALTEPSLATPFIEPHLPFYEGVRGEKDFAALLTETASKDAE